MSGLFSRPKSQRIPPPPKQEAPAIPEKGEAEGTKQRTEAKAGRGGTILAGELTPETKKKKVLG